ncbi:MAG TPA: hypothetical protein VNR42_01495, partial [Solirubrobacteraceae bacterium]|nr:hypothetical protein [Solirubrobacteraceae bacterium]
MIGCLLAKPVLCRMRGWRTAATTALVAMLTLALADTALAVSKAPVPPSHQALTAGRWSLLIAAGALVFGLPIALFLLSLILWAITLGEVPIALTGPGRILRGALIGADNRVSTSKTVMVVWTYSVASALLSFVIAKWWGHPQGFTRETHLGLQAEYALLVGGPLSAAILAKGIVNKQETSSNNGKPAAVEAHASQLVSDDQGNTDLGDLQYVLFNAVALVFFFGELIHAPTAGLPTIPDVLLGLTSVSAAGYVGKKTLASLAPAIVKVNPKTGIAEQTITIYGSGLFDVDNMIGTVPKVVFQSTRANASAIEATVQRLEPTPEGLALEVVVPRNAAPGKYRIAVTTIEGKRA